MIEHAYIHIPFCLRKCRYCSFASGESIAYKKQYLDSLNAEIIKRYNGEILKTIYIGGGTPSLLEPADIEKLLNNFKYISDAEITLEANPETVNSDKIIGYKDIGINRISLGVQTFDDNILNQIGRGHSSNDAIKAVETVKNAKFKNISIDLIYGLPNQTEYMFTEDIYKAVNLGVQHISSYGLKIEEGSFFFNNMPENLPDDEIQAKMYLKMCEKLKDNGFEHYEISNFAKKGFESKHNNAYWLNKEYYGFGLNASGYEKNIRYRNISNFNDYIKNPLLREEEISLTEQETMENEIILALRLYKGLNITEFYKKYNVNFIKRYKSIIEKYNDFVELHDNRIRLNEKGFLLSNEIMSEFIVE